jgi:hypothetical protein
MTIKITSIQIPIQTQKLLKVFYVIMHIKVNISAIHNVAEHLNLFHK